MRSFKREIRQETESNSKTSKWKSFEEEGPHLHRFLDSLSFIENDNQEKYDNKTWTEVVKGTSSKKLKLIPVSRTTVTKEGKRDEGKRLEYYH